MKLLALLDRALGDRDADQVRRSHAAAIRELQVLPAAELAIVGDFVVPNNGSVLVPHRLGRKPRMVWCSPPRVEFGTAGLTTGGILIDLPGAGVDRSKTIRLFANGFGVPVTVTVAVA